MNGGALDKDKRLWYTETADRVLPKAGRVKGADYRIFTTYSIRKYRNIKEVRYYALEQI